MAGWGGPWSSLLRSLTIPQGAGFADPRVFIGTDDPIAELLGQDAAIVFYWGPNRAFVLSVEDSGGLGEVGQIHLWGNGDRVGNTLSQYIDIDYDRLDAFSDRGSYKGGNGAVTLLGETDTFIESNLGDIFLSAYNDGADPFFGVIWIESDSHTDINAGGEIRLQSGAGLFVQGYAASVLCFTDVARASANLDLTVVPQDVTGATITATGLAAGMRWEVEAFGDMRNLLTNSTQGVVSLAVNGSGESSQMLFAGQTAGVRGTQGQLWSGTIPSDGDYTFKLQGFRVGGADASIRVSSLHSGLRLRVYI